MGYNPQLEILKQGAHVWNKWRRDNSKVQIDLAGAYLNNTNVAEVDFTGSDLSEANLSKAWFKGICLKKVSLLRANLAGAYLDNADLSEANLSGANLQHAQLGSASLFGANLYRADLHKANLRNADLRGTNLREANLSDASLSDANLSSADLTGANLRDAWIIGANVSETILTNCAVNGMRDWDLKGHPADQSDPIITRAYETAIIVDDFQVKKLMYSLLYGSRLSENVINTFISKAVLVLGKYTQEQKAVLDGIREELRRQNFIPILVDFNKPGSATSSLETLMRNVRFIIVDLTALSSVLQDLTSYLPSLTPVLPIRLKGVAENSRFRDLVSHYLSVFNTHEYENSTSLIATLPQIIGPVNKMAELNRTRRMEVINNELAKQAQVVYYYGGGDTVDSSQTEDDVKCSVFAPPSAPPGHNVMVQVFAHLHSQEEKVNDLAIRFDEETKLRGEKQLEEKVKQGIKLIFSLSMKGLDIDEPEQYLTWRGSVAAVQYVVSIPEGHLAKDVIGTVYVSQDSVPIGHVKFLFKVLPTQNNTARPTASLAPPPSEFRSSWRHYKYAFISYATADRQEVLKRVQMLPRFGINFFQDLLSLEPGQRWEKELYKHIDNSDVFFLFWSTAAKNSSWVLQEVRYAISRQSKLMGLPEIVPIIIEGPPPVPPPEELKDIHFNDTFIYFINAENSSGL